MGKGKPESSRDPMCSLFGGILSVVDVEYERYQAVAQRHYARESSTLVITTFLSAGALAFLAIVTEGTVPIDPRFYAAGIGFGVLGIAYHELTVLTIDRKELRQIMRPMEDKLGLPKRTEWDKFFQFTRWLVFRLAVVTPAAGLLRIWGPLDNLDLLVFIVVVWLPYPLVLSIFHYLLFEDC